MKDINYIVYAIRNKETEELLNKRTGGNPFYISEYQAKQGLEYYNKYSISNKNCEIVKFKLVELLEKPNERFR